MYCLTLSVLLVQTWTYAGFLAQPASPAVALIHQPISPVHSGDSLLESKPLASIAEESHSQPHSKDIPPGNRSAVSNRIAPAATYRLADASGQVWEHVDPVWLQQFVTDRNRLVFGLPD